MNYKWFNIHNFIKVKEASAVASLNFEDFMRQDGFPSIKYIEGGGTVYTDTGWATHQMDEHEYTVFVLKWG